MREMENQAYAWQGMDDSAVARVMKKAAAGQNITVAALGGSITEGFHSSCPQKSYAGIMRKWWEDKFPNITIQYVNAGIGATDSYLGLHRARRDVLQFQPDFIIVDFTVNDQAEEFYGKSYERLIRTLLGAESNPAVVLLFMTMEDGTNAQEFHSKAGEKYKLPMISYGNVVLAEIEAGKYQWKDISPDDIHPNDRGHAIAGRLVCAYLDRIYDTYIINQKECAAKKEEQIETGIALQSEEGKILDAAGIIPISEAGWVKADLHPHLHEGWLGSSCAGSLEFELEFANFGITYLKSIEGAFGKAEIYIDGQCQAVLDGNFPDGWGNYGQSDEVYTSQDRQKHHVEIKVVETGKEVKFGVLALLVS